MNTFPYNRIEEDDPCSLSFIIVYKPATCVLVLRSGQSYSLSHLSFLCDDLSLRHYLHHYSISSPLPQGSHEIA